MTIQQRFEQFDRANPEVYKTLLRYAWTVQARGFINYSIKSLWERVRWHHDFEAPLLDSGSFKLCNDYHSRYARKLMQEPGLAGFFRTRKLRAI